jgi:histidinol-phosphate phosphatase family protein
MSVNPLSQVAILAGGMGTRLAAKAGNLPKPMVPVMGKPLLQHQIELCQAHGFTEIALLVHHRHEIITGHFGDGERFGVRIRYHVEEDPRGTAGALRDALPGMAERFLLLYGDTYLDVDLTRLWACHAEAGAAATLFLHPNDHPQDSDLVDIDAQGCVRKILPYPHPSGLDCRNLVNAALYVLERDALDTFAPAIGKSDIAKNMFPAMLAAGKRLQGYVSPEYIKDMGTPERLEKVERDIEVGLPERLSNRSLRAAVFLDRDGTLNREVDHLRWPEQLELLDGTGEAVRRLNRAGVLSVVTTNQPVVARGDVTTEQLDRIHARLETLLGASGAFLDALYLCPHHPDKGFPGEVAALKIACQCRKPMPGMIDTACRDLAIDRARSWMVGDSTADIEAGRRAGVRTILLRTGHAGRDDKRPLRPDYVCPDLTAAVEWILTGHTAMNRLMLPVTTKAAQGTRLVLIGGLARSGKSSAAQVLKEQLTSLGLTAHAVSLDSWLKPPTERPEGRGVLARFDMAAATSELRRVALSTRRSVLETRTYDRLSRNHHRHTVSHSIGTADVLIVEGVPALLVPELATDIDTIKVHVHAAPQARAARLAADYRWRGIDEARLEAMLASRDLDESVPVNQAEATADFVISAEDPK